MKKLVSLMVIMLFATISLTARNKDSINSPKDSTSIYQTVAANDSADFRTEPKEISNNKNEAIALLSSVNDNLVPLTGIVAVFGMPVLIILITFIYNHKKQKAQYELAAKALEAGKDIPEGLFGNKNTEEKNTLTKGVINTFAGIGIAILLWALVDIKFASIGVLVTCIGIGQIIIYRVMNPTSRKSGSNNIENRQNKEGEE